MIYIIDVKFASRIKSISFVFLTHTPMCVSTCTQYFPESCEKISQVCYSGGIRTHDPRNSRAVSYQLDYRDCPVARGSFGRIRGRIWYLKTLDTIGYCQRSVFSLGVSQHMPKLTNL